MDISSEITFLDWSSLSDIRQYPAQYGADGDVRAIEGIMLKQKNSCYMPGRPKGYWFKWKRDPYNIDAVLMLPNAGMANAHLIIRTIRLAFGKASARSQNSYPSAKPILALLMKS